MVPNVQLLRSVQVVADELGFKVQCSRKLNLGGTLPHFGNFRNVEMLKRHPRIPHGGRNREAYQINFVHCGSLCDYDPLGLIRE